MTKRIVKMPPPLATEPEAREIRLHLLNTHRSFSSYAMEAIKEKMDRERMTPAIPIGWDGMTMTPQPFRAAQ